MYLHFTLLKKFLLSLSGGNPPLYPLPRGEFLKIATIPKKIFKSKTAAPAPLHGGETGTIPSREGIEGWVSFFRLLY